MRPGGRHPGPPAWLRGSGTAQPRRHQGTPHVYRHRNTCSCCAHRSARPVPAQPLNQLTSRAARKGTGRGRREPIACQGSNAMTGPAAPYGTASTRPPLSQRLRAAPSRTAAARPRTDADSAQRDAHQTDRGLSGPDRGGNLHHPERALREHQLPGRSPRPAAGRGPAPGRIAGALLMAAAGPARVTQLRRSSGAPCARPVPAKQPATNPPAGAPGPGR